MAAAEPSTTRPSTQSAPALYLVHFPGIGGHMLIDDLLTRGFSLAEPSWKIEIDDWTRGNPGLAALTNIDGNKASAREWSKKLEVFVRANPRTPIFITSHSGGTGIAAWVLEDLPDDVHVQSVLMIASALSPRYDLSRALRHIDRRLIVLVSDFDEVLGAGTQQFGTIDRKYTDSAGKVGFTFPFGGDREQYKKLVQIPYDAAWLALDNDGGHIGAMNPLFSRAVIVPLLETGRLPEKLASFRPGTRPFTRAINRAATPPATLPASP